jgi:hypothetical protein
VADHEAELARFRAVTQAIKKLPTDHLQLLDNPRLMNLAVLLRTFPAGFFESLRKLEALAKGK